MSDWRDSRHPLAIRYNELGNRLLDVEDMTVSVREDAMKQGDPLSVAVFHIGWQPQVEEMKREMISIERQFERDSEWCDHCTVKYERIQ